MNQTAIKNKSEHGGAGVKMTIVLVVLFLVGYAAFNYVPIAYEGQSFKQDMQTAVVQGTVLPQESAINAVKGKLQKAMASNNIPPDAVVRVTQTSNNVQAHITYSKQVMILPFGMYKYNYNFDYTATPTGFLTK